MIRSALLGGLGVIAIIVGLIAMHTPGGDATHSVPAVALTSIAHHAGDSVAMASEAATGHPATDPCEETACGPEHLTTLMACILGVLLITLTFGAAPMVSQWGGPLRSTGQLRHAAVRAAPLPPPSLVALSISRT